MEIISQGDSVRVTHINKLPSAIENRDLGKRRLDAQGIVINAAVPGLDTEAFLVEHREEFGERCGETAIYFPGEVERIPDIVACRD
ncbi:MAG TPA: hypothetical protein VMA75_03665 [Candidatus Paceibacterota bacterium]|nr:hypothetical protein [Candidatus Paceibacterota bacterium]